MFSQIVIFVVFAAHRKCALNRSENRDFQALRENQINVSCECHQPGYEWSSRFGLCVDVNECTRGTHNCTLENGESCLNLPGHYDCVCRLGYVYNPEMKRCVYSLEIEKVLKGGMLETETAKKEGVLIKVIKAITRSNGYDSVTNSRINYFLIVILFIYVEFIFYKVE